MALGVSTAEERPLDLLRRVLLSEVLACACGGTRRVIASVEEGPAARKILRHLGLPREPPALAAARVDQHDLWPTVPPTDEVHDPPWVDDVERSPSHEPHVVVGPVLSPGFTDSLYARPLGTRAYGFVPFVVTKEEATTMHGHGERVSVENVRCGLKVLLSAVADVVVAR